MTMKLKSRPKVTARFGVAYGTVSGYYHDAQKGALPAAVDILYTLDS